MQFFASPRKCDYCEPVVLSGHDWCTFAGSGSGELERLLLREEHDTEVRMNGMPLHEAMRFISNHAQNYVHAVYGLLGMATTLQHPTVVAHVLHTLERMFDSTVRSPCRPCSFRSYMSVIWIDVLVA